MKGVKLKIKGYLIEFKVKSKSELVWNMNLKMFAFQESSGFRRRFVEE